MVENEGYRDLDIDRLLRLAKADQLPRFPGGDRRGLRLERTYRLELAEEITNAALKEGRAITPEEIIRVDTLLAEAKQITPAIEEAERRHLREVSEPICN